MALPLRHAPPEPDAVKLPRLAKIDLIPGSNDGLVIVIVALAVAYVGSGGWTEKRWKEAVATAGPVVGALIGYRRGFNTYNPALHVDELVKAAAPQAGAAVEQVVNDRIGDPMARQILAPVAGELAERLADQAISKARDVIDPRGIFSVGEDQALSLPPGWSRDEHGHLRDEHGRYASEDAARSWRPG